MLVCGVALCHSFWVNRYPSASRRGGGHGKSLSWFPERACLPGSPWVPFMLSLCKSERSNFLNENHSSLCLPILCNQKWTDTLCFISSFWQEASEVGTLVPFTREESEAHWAQVPCPEDIQMVSSPGPWCPSLHFLLPLKTLCSFYLAGLTWHCEYLIAYYLEFSNHYLAGAMTDVPKMTRAPAISWRVIWNIRERHEHWAKSSGRGGESPPCSLLLSLFVCLSVLLFVNHLFLQTINSTRWAITLVFTPLFLVPRNKYLLNEWFLSELVIQM